MRMPLHLDILNVFLTDIIYNSGKISRLNAYELTKLEWNEALTTLVLLTVVDWLRM